MPRRNRSKKMKGGFRFWPFGNSDSSSSSGIGSSISNLWSSLTGPKKETQASTSLYTPTPASTYNTPAPTYTPVGGKHKSKRRSMKGGYTSNVPTMSLAGHAAPISGVPNAQPQAWVGKGGKRTRRRNKRYNKSYRKH
jgi:hypothetical protein